MKPHSKALPAHPGCYLMKDRSGAVIYVGKAKHLRKRVSSYFTKTNHSPKTRVLIKNIFKVDWIATDNEVEALLLENQLIKQHQPRFNIMLKDSKRYAYIAITNDAFPKLVSIRKPLKKYELFGPFTDGKARAEVVTLLRKHFKIRTCKTLPKRPCLNFYINTCDAPCVGNISEEVYAKNIDAVRKVLKGDTKELLNDLKSCMRRWSTKQDYERAMECRDQLQAIEHIKEKQKVDKIREYDQDVIALVSAGEKSIITLFQIGKGVIRKKLEFVFDTQEELLESFIKAYYGTHAVPAEILVNQEVDVLIAQYLFEVSGHSTRLHAPKRGEKKRLVELVEKNALLRFGDESPILRELQEKLHLPSLPLIIEGFDISNSGDADIVASMVRFSQGAADKKEYRKFIIHGVLGQNDFESIKEAVFRRYKRVLKENGALPDLILIDGGSIQVDFALQALKDLHLKIPLIGLAKKEEEIYLPGITEPLTWDKRSSALKLLQRVRNEAHRFALSFLRVRRAKKMVSSALDEVSGIGGKTKEKLLAKFGSLAGIRGASFQELVSVVGEKKAKIVKNL